MLKLRLMRARKLKEAPKRVSAGNLKSLVANIFEGYINNEVCQNQAMVMCKNCESPELQGGAANQSTFDLYCYEQRAAEDRV